MRVWDGFAFPDAIDPPQISTPKQKERRSGRGVRLQTAQTDKR